MYYCNSCKNASNIALVRGSGWIEFVLYLFYIIPGIIYSIWRRSGQPNVCPICKIEGLVPANNPLHEPVGVPPRVHVSPIDRIFFPEEEYVSLASTGTATVKGQGFLKTRGGDVKTAAGIDVHLNPVTSYSKQWYEIDYLQGKALKSADSRMWKYVKKQIADSSGRFAFINVPAGDYYVTVPIYWEAPAGNVGGVVSKKVSVKDGEEIEIILTR